MIQNINDEGEFAEGSLTEKLNCSLYQGQSCRWVNIILILQKTCPTNGTIEALNVNTYDLQN